MKNIPAAIQVFRENNEIYTFTPEQSHEIADILENVFVETEILRAALRKIQDEDVDCKQVATEALKQYEEN